MNNRQKFAGSGRFKLAGAPTTSRPIAAANLTGMRSVNDATAINIAEVVIRGGERKLEAGTSNMPAFGSTYSDAEIASVVNFVTARFGAAKLRSQD